LTLRFQATDIQPHGVSRVNLHGITRFRAKPIVALLRGKQQVIDGVMDLQQRNVRLQLEPDLRRAFSGRGLRRDNPA
jgi:hypothetical protein